MNDKARLTKIVIAVIIAVAVIGILFVIGAFNAENFRIGKQGIPPSPFPPPPDINRLSGLDANAIALARAREWQQDAKLAKSTSLAGETGVSGRSDDWDLLYVSTTTKNKGFHIIIRNKTILTAEEVPFVAKGGELPANIISSEEAIRRMREIKGYETVPVISVELIYGPDGKTWRWGIQTSKGFTSVLADK